MTSFDDLGGVLVGVRGMTWGIRATRASVHRIVEVQQAPVCFVLCAATFHGVDSSMDRMATGPYARAAGVKEEPLQSVHAVPPIFGARVLGLGSR
jgi:hypothetical protein